MTVRRESDADAMERAMAEQAEARAASAVITLDAYGASCVRQAICLAAKALARLNTKGMPRAHAKEVEDARDALRRAVPYLVKPLPGIAAAG